MKIAKITTKFLTFSAFLAVGVSASLDSAFARDIKYEGSEQTVYVTPGEPTQVSFPGKIEGGFKRSNSTIALQKNDNYLVLFAKPDLPYEGEALLLILDDKRSFAVRVVPADDDHPRDETVKIQDDREETGIDGDGVDVEPDPKPDRGFAPPDTVSGLMRNMIMVSEFGRKKGIRGYRRSNKYSGETVLHDGAVEAKIDEIFMGTGLWGYVLTVENLMDTNQKINPATFRLDGTRAVTAERWELSARPETAEQQLASSHKAKIYIVTKAAKK